MKNRYFIGAFLCFVTALSGFAQGYDPGSSILGIGLNNRNESGFQAGGNYFYAETGIMLSDNWYLVSGASTSLAPDYFADFILYNGLHFYVPIFSRISGSSLELRYEINLTKLDLSYGSLGATFSVIESSSANIVISALQLSGYYDFALAEFSFGYSLLKIVFYS
jgi:hypothetical protein